MENGPLIFVHSSFRTGSTWFQSRFRMIPEFCTYTEIYNESLASLKIEELGKSSFRAWNSKHPPSVPYFLEYAPLIKPEGGVEGFKPEFAFERYFPEDEEKLPEDEYDYIAKLVANARRNGKIPVITCTRSLGRVAALKKAFGGLHLLIFRNIFNQWCSYTEQAATGNPYFLQTIDRTIDGADFHALRVLKNTYRTDAPDANDANCFIKFVLLHCYAYRQAVRAADHAIFMEDLNEAAICQRLVDLIHQRTGRRVDFSGYEERQQFSFIDTEPSLLREAIATFVSYNDDGKDDGSNAVLRRLCDACVDSYVSYRKQFSPLLKAHKSMHAASLAQLSDLEWCRSELAKVLSERDRYEKELEKVISDRDNYERKIGKLKNSFLGRIDPRIRRLGRL